MLIDTKKIPKSINSKDSTKFYITTVSTGISITSRRSYGPCDQRKTLKQLSIFFYRKHKARRVKLPT